MKLPYLTFNYIFNISLTRQGLKKFFVGKKWTAFLCKSHTKQQSEQEEQVKMGESFDEDKQRKRERERKECSLF